MRAVPAQDGRAIARSVHRRNGNTVAAMFRPSTLLAVAYLVAGLIVAASNDYLHQLDTVRRVVSALLAILLWPLVLLGIDLHIRG